MIAKLLKLLPEHRTYVEPFCGAAAIFFAKAPSEVETLNDIHSGVVGLFRILRDNTDEFMHLARHTPYSRELWFECRDNWENEPDPTKRAWMWWYVACTSFSGLWGRSISTSVSRPARGMADTCSKFLSRIDMLPAMVERLRQTQIEHVDGVYCLERYCTADGLAYVDPPYVAATRTTGKYQHEFSDDAHSRLVDALLHLPGRFMVSGYQHSLYQPLDDAGWSRTDYETACYASPRTRHTGILGEGSATTAAKRVESVWVNPPDA